MSSYRFTDYINSNCTYDVHREHYTYTHYQYMNFPLYRCHRPHWPHRPSSHGIIITMQCNAYERLFPPIPNTYCVSFNYNSINICLLCLLLLLLLIYIFVIHCQLFCICWWHKIFPFSSKKQMQVKIDLIEKIAKNMSINIFKMVIVMYMWCVYLCNYIVLTA